MKLNISYPATGSQKIIEIEDETQLRALFDKRMSHEIEGDLIDQKFKGYVFRISGGNDKQGFPMMQGVLSSSRVRLLFEDGMKCFRIRKRGERKRKSVRGCIVSADLSVINLVIIKKGDAEIEGITDVTKPRRLGPKRASKIRKLFALKKDDDVREFVVRRKVEPKAAPKKDEEEGEDGEKKAAPAAPEKKPRFKAVRIQRLVTPARLQRKKQYEALKKARYTKSRAEAEEYNKLLNQRLKEKRSERESKLAKKRSLSRLQSGGAAAAAKPEPKKEAPKKEEPKKEAPKKEAAKAAKKEEPKKDAKKEAPKKEEPKKEAPKKEAPKKEAPKAEPKKEAKKEAPKQEAPKKTEKPKKK